VLWFIQFIYLINNKQRVHLSSWTHKKRF